MDIYKIHRIRPYQSFNLCKLFRVKFFFFLCKYNHVVKNLNRIYNTSTRIFGKNFTNKFIEQTFCDFLTGGSDFNSLGKTITSLQEAGLYSSVGFCREFLTKDKENEVVSILDSYIKSIDLAITVNRNNLISLKVSSLCDIEKLKVFNEIQLILKKIDDSIVNNIPDVDIMKRINSIVKINLDEHYMSCLRSIRTSLGLNLIEIFARNSPSEFENLSKIFNCDLDTLNYGNIFYTRLLKILSYSSNHHCSVLYDAEQSYIQNILDSSSLYFSLKYNKDFPIIIQTIQCYLKDSPQKIDYFIKFYRENHLKTGLKIVRGAYIVEETKLCTEKGYESLILNTIEETHYNYNEIMRKLVSSYKEGDKFVFASHNEDSVLLLTELLDGNNHHNKDIYCAQLIGISDHITILCKLKGLKTIKYVSYGEINIMIPYLIRRSEETSILTKLQIQTRLLNEEIYFRLIKPAYFIALFVILSIFFK